MKLSYKTEKDLLQDTGEQPQSLPIQIPVHLVLGYTSFTAFLFQGTLTFLHYYHPLSHIHHFTWSCLSGSLCLLTRSGRETANNDPVSLLRKQLWGKLLDQVLMRPIRCKHYCPPFMASYVKHNTRNGSELKIREVSVLVLTVLTWE